MLQCICNILSFHLNHHTCKHVIPPLKSHILCINLLAHSFVWEWCIHSCPLNKGNFAYLCPSASANYVLFCYNLYCAETFQDSLHCRIVYTRRPLHTTQWPTVDLNYNGACLFCSQLWENAHAYLIQIHSWWPLCCPMPAVISNPNRCKTCVQKGGRMVYIILDDIKSIKSIQYLEKMEIWNDVILVTFKTTYCSFTSFLPSSPFVFFFFWWMVNLKCICPDNKQPQWYTNNESCFPHFFYSKLP